MDKKISELDQALQINNDAVFPMSQDNSGTDTTYKATITQLSTEIGEGQTFSNLQTTDKTLVGAINEVAQGGGGGGPSNANLAPNYDANSTYAVGDWCIYNGTLYQCNTAIPTAEAFDPTHWTAKKVVDAFADIKDYIDSVKGDVDDLQTNKLDKGPYNSQQFINECKFDMAYTGSLNDAPSKGVSFVSGTNLSNAPSSGYVFCISVSQNGNANYANQFAFALSSQNIYVRSCNGGTWSSWRTI